MKPIQYSSPFFLKLFKCFCLTAHLTMVIAIGLVCLAGCKSTSDDKNDSIVQNDKSNSTASDLSIRSTISDPKGWADTSAASLSSSLKKTGLWQTDPGEMKSIDIASCPDIKNFFGNNPASPYIAPFLPAIPGYTQPQLAAGYECMIDASGKQPIFNLGKSDAVVIFGTTPPLASYFGFTQYVYSSFINGIQFPFFASVMDTVNNLTMGTSTTPLISYRNNGTSTTAAFNSQYVIIMSPDRKTDEELRDSIHAMGIADSMINSLPFPFLLANPGTGPQADVFTLLQRVALFENSVLGSEYLAHVPAAVLRVTALGTQSIRKPFPIVPYASRGTGYTEEELVPGITQAKEELVRAVRAAYPDYQISEMNAYPHIPSGIQCLLGKPYCLTHPKTMTHADNQDTTYNILGGGILGEKDFAIAVGVDHTATKHLAYAGVGVFDVPLSLGVGGFTQKDYHGSADTYLPNGKLNSYLFAYKMARQCDGPFCYVVPVEFPGVPLEDLTRVTERAYLETETRKGPNPAELVLPTLFRFRPLH